MTVHISARVAWHDSGWNGSICRNPKGNTYCTGQYSYPADTISEKRNTDWEQSNAGKPCKQLDEIPPCIYSINAFGKEELKAFDPPPTWFRDDTKTKTWPLPPATVCLWPYEEMYKEEVLNPSRVIPKYNPDKRRKAVNTFFDSIIESQSLIFYYANYSNPFSENDERHYVLVGVSSVKKVGEELTWIGQSKEKENRYGAYVWMRNVTSNYPDEGLRIPYHMYQDAPEKLERLLFKPENSRDFKYATRHISDDGALGLIERFTEIVGTLREMGDTSENWEVRQNWLASLTADLWQNRGLFPGILHVWDYLKFREAISYTIEESSLKEEKDIKEGIFAFLQEDADTIEGLSLNPERAKSVRKAWKYLTPEQQTLLRDTLPRFDLKTPAIRNILDNPESVCIRSSHNEIDENPYILSEQYIGSNPDDQITFSQVDHGMIPSPELGETFSADPDDWRRLRALCVEQLQRANQHTFLPAEQVLDGLNYKLSFLPEWKRAQFTLRHLEVEKVDLEGALTYREDLEKLYLYRKTVFEDERLVESTLRQLAARKDIELRFPVLEANWVNYLKKADSKLAIAHPREYEEVITQQVAVCQSIFRRPLSVLCGAAGTGKTTVIEAIISAIEKGHGRGTSFQLLAPTGKATDRLRERTQKDANTIHSFLAQRGWLNDNLTYVRQGGKREEGITTYIIDESSMLDLNMLATLFRAINWTAVQRLIFVGDPNQLPPIGVGKVFADNLDWLKSDLPDNIGELKINMRQIENRLTGQGTGILDLANVFERNQLEEEKSAEREIHEEKILTKIQTGGEVDADLRVLYWDNTDQLEQILTDTIISDMEKDTGESLDTNRPDRLWDLYLGIDEKLACPERSQVISPYRGELFGIDHLNLVLQNNKNNWMKENKGALGGVTYKDKVIQVRNRPKSDPIWAFNNQTNKNEKIQIFNGQIGYTKVHGFDHKKWSWSGFKLGQFQVVFTQRPDFWVNFTSDSEVNDNLELAYAISVHKSQGSEFGRVYFVLPKHKRGLLSRELIYTGLTRAQNHCTLLVQEDMSPILSLRRRERSHLLCINSSLFQFNPIPKEFQRMFEWYEEGKIHRALANYMVRSKSEVIIANMLFERDIPFTYETPLYAPDGTMFLPDFTVNWHGEIWYWEHEGMTHNEEYRNHQEAKHAWYQKHGFFDRLVVTKEQGGFDSHQVKEIIEEHFSH